MRMKKTSRKQLRILRRRRLALALVGAMAMPMMPAMAQDLPSTGNVVTGTASIGQAGKVTTITQTTKGAIIDWGSFSIGTGYGVTFDQQFGASSVTLNRVVGTPSVSIINGTLTSNGNVFIINPAGITFGSGAQVNVGGLVASTLAISNADFLAGVSSGQYRFSASGSEAGAIFNSGQLTAADGGTIGLIGSYINNSGTITANLGSVVFGATSQVTLDFFGDGLTQVTVSGNGLAQSNCNVNCTGGIASSGNVFAQGGHIEMRSNTMDGQSAGTALFVDPANGGRIWIGGNVAAQTSGNRRGSIIIDAGMGNIDLGGVEGRTGHVSAFSANAGEDAGTIELRGNQLFTHLCFGNGGQLCVANNRLGLVNASAFGTGGSAGEIRIDVNRFYHGGVLQAIANDGSGGLIDIRAGNAEIYNRIWAYGNNGTGGTINIDANSLLLFRGQQPWLGGPGTAFWSASLLAYGTTTGGTVNIDTGSLVVTDLGNVVPQFDDVIPVINVTGQLGGNGGSVNINADYASIDDTLFADASGDGQGGSINIAADELLLYGGLVANGGTTGGSVTTSTTDTLIVAASAYVDAATWSVRAPQIDIVTANDLNSGAGTQLVDTAIGASLGLGTSIDLVADGDLVAGGTGAITIRESVSIVHEGSDEVAFDLTATGSISGVGFEIASLGGPLDMSFTANSAGGNASEGYVSFNEAVLDSNGGDIDLVAEGRGVYLGQTSIDSGGGDIYLLGASETYGSGVLIEGGDIASGGGDIDIDGSTIDYAGVLLLAGDIGSGGGDIRITGEGGFVGVLLSSSSSVAGGDGLVTLIAGNSGVADSIMLGGSISSNTGVNLRPLDGTDAILLGSGAGFSLSAAELALIDAPELVIGSAQHAGAISVQQAVTRDGNVTLQNQGGSGGIDLQAGINLGDHTLALATGGDITQSASAVISARSLLALAGGAVLLGTAQNDVASTTLAGSSGGDFEFLDATALAIGTVSARGIDAASGQLSGLGASGITAGGDALVRNLAGDLTLQSGITAQAIDLVTAGALQNVAGAALSAANGWRVWASSWVGETRGGLAGNGALPNLYGCTFNGACAATAPVAGGNYFIYQQQPTATVLIGNATREYGLANPAFAYSVTGAVLGDGQGSVASGTPTSAATIGSNVGTYSITGNFISPAGYALQFSPGTLSITPATLVFTADEMLRYFGFGNPDFTGTFSGFRNGDTLQSAFGGQVSIYSPAGSEALFGYFPIYASGTALNYVIQQAPGNEVALQVLPAPQFASAVAEFVSDPEKAYVYENNIARDWMCPLGTPSEEELLEAAGDDDLGRDWLKVRRRLQLNNCIDSSNTPGCRF